MILLPLFFKNVLFLSLPISGFVSVMAEFMTMAKSFLVALFFLLDTTTCHTMSQDSAKYSMWEKIPEATMNVTEIIKYQGYPVENHGIVTKDGYILSVQRIPYGRQGPTTRKSIPVLLQHGLLDSSVTWIINLPKQSLGFILADAGYDVWLANSRGNVYSNKHQKYTTKDSKFWDFSFDEMAKYDLPACINYILAVSNSSHINYVGHSQGTTIGFAEFTRNKELAKKVRKFVALAPVATVKYIKGAFKYLAKVSGPVFKYLAKVSGPVKLLLNLLGVKNFLPSNYFTKYLANAICSAQMVDNVCAGFLFLMAGNNTENLNQTRVSAYLAHTPAGTSVKDAMHFTQMVKSGKFEMYDYGWAKNMHYYGKWTPPEYDIGELETPLAIFSGSHDWLATPQDIDNSIRSKVKTIVFDLNMEKWNHLDFVWGEDAAKDVYSKIVTMFDEDNK